MPISAIAQSTEPPWRSGPCRTVCVAFDLGADRRGPRIKFAVGEPHVYAGDDERGQELAEADERADIDVAEHLDGHEVGGERTQ